MYKSIHSLYYYQHVLIIVKRMLIYEERLDFKEYQIYNNVYKFSPPLFI